MYTACSRSIVHTLLTLSSSTNFTRFSFPVQNPVRPALQCLLGPLPPRSIGLCPSLIPIHDTDKHKTDESNNDIVGFKGYQLLDSI
jgi:hypothetical protein